MDTATKYIPLIYLGAAIVVAVILWRAVAKAGDIAGNVADSLNETRNNVGSAIGETVFNWFNPASASPDVYISVTFPDGLKHAVSVRDIDSQGYFKPTPNVYPWYDGRRYRIKSSGSIHKAELV